MFIFAALFFLIESLVALVKLLMGKTDYLMLLESQASAKLTRLGQTIKANDEERRKHELARVTEEFAHRDAIRKAHLEDEKRALDAVATRRQNLEAHFRQLREAGVSDEDVEAERSRLLNEKRPRRVLRLVASR